MSLLQQSKNTGGEVDVSDMSQALLGFNFQNSRRYREELGEYLWFLSSENTERNISMLNSAGKKSWPEIADELDEDVTPKHVCVKAYETREDGFMDENYNWTSKTEEMIDAYWFYNDLIEKDLWALNQVARQETARDILHKFPEGTKIPDCVELTEEFSYRRKLNRSRNALYQTTLPSMEERGLINWEGSITSEAETEPPYGVLRDFLEEAESIIRKYDDSTKDVSGPLGPFNIQESEKNDNSLIDKV